jgi:ferritin
MTNRKLSLLSTELKDLLVKQIAHELKNHTLYLSIANFFSVEAISDLQTYYEKRAHEEWNHHKLIMDYLSDADVKFLYPAVEINTETFDSSYTVPFTATVDREIQTTQLIYAIYEQAVSEKDFMTASWLYDKLIKEQIEEENVSRMARTIMEESGDIFIKAERVLDLLEN